MALIDVDIDPWATEIRGCENLAYEITELLSARSKEVSITTDNYARLSTNIRVRIKQFTMQVQQLETSQPSRLITIEERERRMREVETLKSKLVRLQNQFDERGNRQQRRVSDGPSSSGTGFQPYPRENSGVDDIRSHIKNMEQEQDQGLEALSKIVSRQKQIAETIGGEVDTQNDILGDLAERMESTDATIVSQTRSVAIIDRKDATCGYWTVIILLLIAIIVVWLV